MADTRTSDESRSSVPWLRLFGGILSDLAVSFLRTDATHQNGMTSAYETHWKLNVSIETQLDLSSVKIRANEAQFTARFSSINLH